MRNNGFTLVELAIVIAIVLVISAVAVPGFLNYQKYQREEQFVNLVVDKLRNSQNDALVKDIYQSVLFKTNSIEICDVVFINSSKTNCQTQSYPEDIFSNNTNVTYYFGPYGDFLQSNQISLVASEITFQTSNFNIMINQYGRISKQNR